jgi:deoxyadenosine/deoxycytidine kinase
MSKQMAAMGSPALLHFPRGKKLHYAVAGFIGAGKSTLVDALGTDVPNEMLGVSAAVSQEEVDEEQLALYTKDEEASRRHALNFQTVMIDATERRRLILAQKDVDVTFIEREIEENRVFALANTLHKNIARSDYDGWYLTHFRALEKRTYHLPKPSVWVFLYTSQEQAEANKKIRNRRGEENYTANYFDHLFDTYFHWFLRCSANGMRMLAVDWTDFGSPADILTKLADVETGRFQLPVVRYSYTDSEFLDKPTHREISVRRGKDVLFRLPYISHDQRRKAQHKVFKRLIAGTSLSVEYVD